MPDAFFLRWKLDRPFVEQNKGDEVYALVTIEPNASVLVQSSQAALPAHLIILVDVSGSMDILMRHDPNAKSLGDAVTEGKASHKVFSDVPSRREMACTVVQRLTERMHADDLLTLVAFDDKAYVLAQCASPENLDQLWPAIQKLTDVGGGGTALGAAFESVRSLLATYPDPKRTRKLVLLTDGEDEKPTQALTEAQALGRDFNVPIVALGTGECKVSFLKDVAQTTLAGSFNHIRTETDAEQLFHQVLTGQKNVQATNVALKLWLSPEMQVRELYRTRPEILYVGDLQPDAANLVELRLEQMERGKAYEFLFRCTLPARPAPQRFRLAKASLVYDLPGQGRSGEAVEANLVVEYTADAERARERSGDVRRVLARAEVQRQVLFLQGKVDSIRRGTATDRDRKVVAALLKALIARFEDFGEQAMVNQYRQLQEEFLRRGTISQDMLNRSLAASSRAEAAVAVQDIDF